MLFSHTLFLISVLALPVLTAPQPYNPSLRTWKRSSNAVDPSLKSTRDLQLHPPSTLRLQPRHFAGCTKVKDCTCPATARSTSCINGQCVCDSAAVNFFADNALDVIKALAKSKVLKGFAETFKVISDIKEVGPIVAGRILGPEAKVALKVAMKAMPDVGPSHIDAATRKMINAL